MKRKKKRMVKIPKKVIEIGTVVVTENAAETETEVEIVVIKAKRKNENTNVKKSDNEKKIASVNGKGNESVNEKRSESVTDDAEKETSVIGIKIVIEIEIATETVVVKEAVHRAHRVDHAQGRRTF